MLTLAWRVARQVGLSPRASERLCRRMLGGPRPSAEQPGRRTRARLLGMLRDELGSHVDGAGLERALRDAVALDELDLLPPRQRFVIWSAIVHQRRVGQIADQVGWTRGQVARLMRVGLSTMTVWSHQG
jgi:AraC-like DNA-binding protein